MDPDTTHKSKVKPCTSSHPHEYDQILKSWVYWRQMTMTARALWIQLNHCACAVMWWHRTYASAEKSDSVTDASPDCLWRVVIKSAPSNVVTLWGLRKRIPRTQPDNYSTFAFYLPLQFQIYLHQFVRRNEACNQLRKISGAKRNFR